MVEKRNELPKLEQVNGERVTSMGRRRFVTTLAGAGFGAAAIEHLTPEDIAAAASDQVPIVIGFSSDDPERPAETFTTVKKNVPADWYDELQLARRVNENLKSQFLHREGVIGLGVEPGEYGGRTASVEVDVTPEHIDELRGELPEVVDGIEVGVNQGSEITPLGCDSSQSGCNQSDFYSSIPGGVQCVGDSDEPVGTMMSRMYDENNNRRFATAGHLFKGSNANGKKLYHPDKNADHVGEIVRSHCYDDFVLAAERNSHYPQRRIEDANPEPVNGQFTRDGVTDLKGQDEKVRKVGRTSCKTCGYIENANYTHTGYGCTPKDGQVKWGEGSDSQGGDSGAPVYHLSPKNSSYQWIVSLDLWSGCCSAGGTSAWSIKNKHEYHF